MKPGSDVRWEVFPTCDLCLFGLHQLSHHGQNVLASLRSKSKQLFIGDYATAALILTYRTSAVTYLGSGICNIQVMQCDILDDLLLFVDITFGQRHILLCLQVELCSKCVTATLSLQRHSTNKISLLSSHCLTEMNVSHCFVQQ